MPYGYWAPKLWFPPRPLDLLISGYLRSTHRLCFQPQHTLGRTAETYHNCRFHRETLTVGVTLHLFKMDGSWTSPYPRLPAHMKAPRYHDDSSLTSSIILDMILSRRFGSVGFAILFSSGGGESVFVVRWVFLLFDNPYLKRGLC